MALNTGSVTAAGTPATGTAAPSDNFPPAVLKSLETLEVYLRDWELQPGDHSTKAVFIFKPTKQSYPVALPFEWDATAKSWKMVPNLNPHPIDTPLPTPSAPAPAPEEKPAVPSTTSVAPKKPVQQAHGAINSIRVILATDLGLPAAALAHVVPTSAVTNLNSFQVGAVISFNINGLHPYISVDYAQGGTVSYDPVVGGDPNDYGAKPTGDTYQTASVSVGLEMRTGNVWFSRKHPSWFVSFPGLYTRLGIGYRWTQSSTGKTTHEAFTESMPELFSFGQVTPHGAWFASISHYLPVFNPNRQAMNLLDSSAPDRNYLGLNYVGAMLAFGFIPGWTEQKDYDRLPEDSSALMTQHLYTNGILGVNSFMQTLSIGVPAIDAAFDELTHSGTQDNYNTGIMGGGFTAILNAGNDVRQQRALTQVWRHGKKHHKIIAGIEQGLFILGYGIGTVKASTNRYPTLDEAKTGFSGTLGDHYSRAARINFLPQILNLQTSLSDAAFLSKPRPLWAHGVYQGIKALLGVGMVWYPRLPCQGVTGGGLTSYSILGDGDNFKKLHIATDSIGDPAAAAAAQYAFVTQNDPIGKNECTISVGQAGMGQIFSATGGAFDIAVGNTPIKKSGSADKEKAPTGYAELNGEALTHEEEVLKAIAANQPKQHFSARFAIAPDRGGTLPVQGGVQVELPLDLLAGIKEGRVPRDSAIRRVIAKLVGDRSMLDAPLEMAIEAKSKVEKELEVARKALEGNPEDTELKRKVGLAESGLQQAQLRFDQITGSRAVLQAQIDQWKAKLPDYHDETKSAETKPEIEVKPMKVAAN